MFYDLNLAADSLGGGQALREALALAVRLGYHGVALNHAVSGPMSEADACRLKQLDFQSVLAAAPGVAEGARWHQGLLTRSPARESKQLTRITVSTDDTSHSSALNSGNLVLASYDLVAIQPLSQKVFAQACSSLDVDLISLDLSQRLPFRWRPPMIQAALKRGIHFEISYAAALRDLQARRQLFSNAQALVTATRGKNLVITSGAQQAFEMRGPYDVANMATLFGMSVASAKAALAQNCLSVLIHAETRKMTYKAAVQIEPSPAPVKSSAFAVSHSWGVDLATSQVGEASQEQPGHDAVNAAEQARTQEPVENSCFPGLVTSGIEDRGKAQVMPEQMPAKMTFAVYDRRDATGAFVPSIGRTAGASSNAGPSSSSGKNMPQRESEDFISMIWDGTLNVKEAVPAGKSRLPDLPGPSRRKRGRGRGQPQALPRIIGKKYQR
eukprot:SM000012S25402  [mRNA]  locus=s12:922924:925913:+ [translate_table: standard]